MKKRCCCCNSAITQDKLCLKNHDLTRCMSKLSLKSIDNTQVDFSDKQNHTGRRITTDNCVRYITKSEQTKEKISININTLILILCLKYTEKFICSDKNSEWTLHR